MQKTPEEIIIEKKLEAIRHINEEKDQVEQIISNLAGHRLTAFEVRTLFMKIPESEKREMLEKYFNVQKLILIDRANELMK